MKKSGKPLTAPSAREFRMSRRAAISILLAGEISHIHAQASPWAAASEAGSTALEQGRKKEANQQFELALDQARRSNADDLIVAQCLDNLALAANGKSPEDRDKQREKLYQESLALRTRRLGADHPEVARSLANVAWTLRDPRRGEQMFTRALDITNRKSDDAAAAEVLERYGTFRHRYSRNQDELRSIEPIYRHLIELREQSPGDANLGLAMALELNAVLLGQTGRVAEGMPFAARASQIRRNHVQKLAGGGDPPPAGQGGTFKIGNGVTGPAVTTKVEPQYSDVARMVKHQGTSVFQIVVTKEGSADSIRLLRGLGLGLDEEGFFAVREWKFRPGQKDDQPVDIVATIEVNFRLL